MSYKTKGKPNRKDTKGKPKTNTKGKRFGKDEEDDNISDRRKEVINDAAWYIPEEILRTQVGSFSMNGINGVDMDLTSITGTIVNDATYKVPSVMGIAFNPCPGVTDGANLGVQGEGAPINLAARRLYSAISAENSKTTQYQPQDLAMALLAVGELQSLISLAYKLYGLAFNYNERNRTVPRLLIKAMGCNPDSILNDLAGFRMRLNVLLVAANEIRFPSDIKWFTKCWDLFSSYYIDDTSLLGQYYIPTIYSYWLLDETGQNGSELKTKYICRAATYGEWTANNLLDCIDEVINTLLTSTTMNYIYADVLNYIAKRGGELLNYGYLPETYVIPPMYNEEFLTQIHNANIIGEPNNTDVSHTSKNDVVQVVPANTLKYSPRWESADPNYKFYNHKMILDFPFTMNPTPDDKINALIYKATLTQVVDNSGTFIGYYPALPDHYVVMVRIWKSETSAHTVTSNTNVEDNQIATLRTYVRRLAMFDKFRAAPILYIGYNNATPSDISGDLNFYGTVDAQQMINLYNYTVLGLLDFHTISNRKR